MSKSEVEFQPFTVERIVRTPRVKNRRRSLIANDEIQLADPVTVAVEDFAPEGLAECNGEIRPILEGGSVVGVMHLCSCGRTSEILFEYESIV